MSDSSTIQWTDSTWNPTRGCSVVSPGCINCYAMKQARRFDTPGGAYEGLTKMTSQGAQWTGKIALVEAVLEAPLHWRTPRRIFVDSMSDLFHPDVPCEFVDRVFAVMALCPSHTFQVLTKRPERMREYLSATATRARIATTVRNYLSNRLGGNDLYVTDVSDSILDIPGTVHGSMWPLPNVWLGTSVEDQPRADERIPLLLDTLAAVRFISAEPLLGPIDLDAPWPGTVHSRDFAAQLDWVIVGGESGPKARPFDLAWARSLRDQCAVAGTAFFLKQLGTKPTMGTERVPWGRGYPSGQAAMTYRDAPKPLPLRNRHGGDPAEWPEDLRACRAFPSTAVTA